MQPAVLVDTPRPGVTRLTLARPDVRNAMSPELTAAWAEAVAAVAADDAVRAVVVTGQGSAFCAGGDLSWLAVPGDPPGTGEVTPERLRERMRPFYRAWLAVRELAVPVVAAVNGPAVGAGLCLALACDLRVAAPTARFSAPFTRLGMHAGMAASWLLPEAVGMARARELLYTGRVLSAEEACSWGLVGEVAEDAGERALELAAGIAAAAPVATRLTKAGLARGGGFSDALEWEALAQPVTMATEDLQEGLRAQAERRAPRFTGR